MSESLELSLTVNRASATLPDLAPLAWLANAIETAVLWFFGRGAFSLTLTRERSNSGATVLTVRSETEPGPLNFSAAAPITSLVQAQRFPPRLLHRWVLTKDDQQAMTMIENSLKQHVTLAALAYDLADTACAFFKNGAMIVQVQYSLEHCQIKGGVRLDDDQLAKFADRSAPSYAAGDYVGMLPWPKDDSLNDD